MKTLTFLGVMAAFGALAAMPLAAQEKKDGGEKPKKGGEEPKKGPSKEAPEKDHKCGKSAAQVYEEWKKQKGVDLPALEQNIKDHYKKHPDDVCHCLCGHEEEGGFKKEGVPGTGEPKKIGPAPEGKPKKPGPAKCGCEKPHDGECKERPKGGGEDGGFKKPAPPSDGGFKKPAPSYDGPPKKPGPAKCGCEKPHDGECRKKGGGDDGGFKKEGAPSDGAPKKTGYTTCTCDQKHDGECSKEKQKGNNGVGNGVDPQPPGKAPVNDGPGSEPGKPGQKKGKGGGEKKS